MDDPVVHLKVVAIVHLLLELTRVVDLLRGVQPLLVVVQLAHLADMPLEVDLLF